MNKETIEIRKDLIYAFFCGMATGAGALFFFFVCVVMATPLTSIK